MCLRSALGSGPGQARTFATGELARPHVVGTVPEKGSQEGAPEEVIAYLSEDVSTAGATFTLAGPKGEMEGALAYYSESPCEPEGPSCYHWHFAPYDPLTTGQYTAEVFGVTDRAGLEMAAAYAWSFEVMEEIGGEMLSPATAEAARAAEPVDEDREKLPAAGTGDAEAGAREVAVDEPAGEGGEIEGGTPGELYVRTTSYYYFGGQRVAMRQTGSWGGDVVYYLLSDHVGTTSVVLDANGDKVAESRHYPYGAVRWTWPEDESTFPTDYRFTGQRDVGLGLTHMGARFLDVALGRWLSADTIVPDPGNPQSLNRYSYVYNNPLAFRDPSGHRPFGACETGEVCHDSPGRGPINQRAASTCSVIALVADISSFVTGGAGALVEILAFTGGAAEPLPLEEGSALALYYETINPIENTLSAVGTGSVAAGDWFGGYNYRDEATNEWVLGQDTTVSLFALWSGNQSVIPLEGIGDTAVNGPLVLYDLARMTGNFDSVIETRIGFNANRGGLYVDVVVYGALAARLGVESGTRVQIALNLGVEIGEVPWEELLYDAADPEK